MSATDRTRDGLATLIKEAGNQNTLAAHLHVSRQAIGSWIQRGYVPLERVADICEKFPNLTREILRPDVYNGDISALEKLIIANGGVGELAKMLGLDPGIVSRWSKGERNITPVYVRRLVKIAERNDVTKGITPHDLRPDIYGAPLANA